MHSSKDFIKCSSPPIISPYIEGQWSVWWTISIKSQKKIGKHFPNAAYSVMKILCYRVKNMAWNQWHCIVRHEKKNLHVHILYCYITLPSIQFYHYATYMYMYNIWGEKKNPQFATKTTKTINKEKNPFLHRSTSCLSTQVLFFLIYFKHGPIKKNWSYFSDSYFGKFTSKYQS